MANKPKISHFSKTNISDSKPVNNAYKDRSKLALLYPEPKTYEQKKEDDKLRQQSYRRHWPKYPYLNIAVYGSAVLGLMIWFVQNLNTWWFSSSNKGIVMSTVFISFAIFLVPAFLLITWIVYVNKQFSYFGGMVRLFWLVYDIILAVILSIWLSGWIGDYTNTLWIPALIVLHFILVFFSAQRILSRGIH